MKVGGIMRFGDDEVAYWIEMSVLEPENQQWAEKWLDVVKQNVIVFLRSWSLSPQDREDIISEVQCKAWQHFPKLYRERNQYKLGQRNGWLKTVTKNECIDYYRRQQRKLQADIPIEEMWNLSDESDEYTRRQTDAQMKLYEAVCILSEINTTPDKCLAFLLNRLLAARFDNNNGRPAKIAEKMEGLSLRVVFQKVKLQLEIQLNGEVPDGILEPIWKKIEPVADQTFHLTARRITDTSNWLSTKSQNEYRKRRNL